MPKKVESVTGDRKAAILLVSLQTEVASQLLASMDREDVERISMEIARLGEVSSEQRLRVLEEFYQTNLARRYIEEGGIDYARTLLEKSLPPDEAASVLRGLEQSIQMTPFHFLQKAEAASLVTFVQDEHPQTIALILAHLQPKQASEILATLPAKKQIEVVKRVARMGQTTPEAIRQVEKGLEAKLSSIVNQDLERAGGVESIAEILNLIDRATEKTILETLEEEDAQLVDRIRRLMFVFEDILLVNDKGIQNVLKEVDQEELALALKAASEDVKNKILKNMSERAAQLIKEDMEYMGPTRLSDVEAAQQRIVDVVRRLEEAGELIVQGRGGEEQIVV
ncbi:MAG TPA: flagellar motor switch protein FliG [Planctomycetota bacterium]|nr:flagellar motor switch protein FliG [Planctomycetota bacterium]